MTSIQKVVLIGSGNVATQLAIIFLDKGIDIIQVYSLHLNNANELAEKIGCEAIDDLSELDQDADLYIIAIKDDAIYALNDHGFHLPGKLVVHTSGSAPLEAIHKISEITGVFYPLQTFSKHRVVHWEKIPVCIEASDPETGELLHEFAERITGSVFHIDSPTRRRLHLAAVFANNFTNYLLGVANEIVGEKLPFTILEPLIQETLDKAVDMGPDAAQTGPAIRCDHKTIEAHLKLLETNPAAKELYEIISGMIGNKKIG